MTTKMADKDKGIVQRRNYRGKVAGYDEKNFPLEVGSLNERSSLECTNENKQKDIAKILGTTPARISEILNSKKGLTIELAEGLYKKLN